MKIFEATIHSKSLELLHKLVELDVDVQRHSAQELSKDDFVVTGIVTEEQVDRLKKQGYTIQVNSDVSGIPSQRLEEVSRQNRFSSDNEWEAESVRGGYLTIEEIDAALAQAVQQYPDLLTMIELPNPTWEGRRCHAVRMRAKTGESSRERVGILITGNVHAREWGGSDISLNMLLQLLKAYKSGQPLSYGNKSFSPQQISNIIENVDLFVFPEVNPDGKAYSQSFHLDKEWQYDPNAGEKFWWRKNRRPNEQGIPVGVDLNRNYDFLWNSGIGTSDNEKDLIYKGTEPFSEPETKNIKHLFDTHPQIRFFVDIHSFGQLILYNWGDDDNQTNDPDKNFRNKRYDGKRGTIPDVIPKRLYTEYIAPDDLHVEESLARRMNEALKAVRGKSYAVKQAAGLYYTSGTGDDYVFSRHLVDPSKPKIYGFTFEFGQQFVPPYEEMQLIIADVSSAITEFCFAVTELKMLAPAQV